MLPSDIPLPDNRDDHDRRLYEELNKPAPHRLLMYRYRQCPDCDAHLFKGTVKHKCGVFYLVRNLKGDADQIRFREDTIKGMDDVDLIYNEDDNGYKTYWIEYNDGHDWICAEEFYSRLQN